MFKDFRTVAPQTGYRIMYRADEVNYCPACSRTQWLIGRMSAECACCSAVLPLMEAGMVGVGLFRSHDGSPPAEFA